MNEWLLAGQVVLAYGAVVAAWRFFGRAGLYAWSVLATVAANIEVIAQVRAFGMDMTLGNVLFASTFLVTDEHARKPEISGFSLPGGNSENSRL